LPSLLSSDSSWLSVTNSASMATMSPRRGISSEPKGMTEKDFAGVKRLNSKS
jgi:hypothetical protein